MRLLHRWSRRWPWLVATLVLAGEGATAQLETRAGEPVREPETRPLVLEGYVLAPDGAPAEGAMVVSSAGGRALCDRDGLYRLEVAVPLEAERLHVTAVGRGEANLVASASVAPSPASVLVPVDTLQLRAGPCSPSWIPSFGDQPGMNDAVEALAVFDDGSGPALYVGGTFTRAGSLVAPGLARWDGAAWSLPGGGLASGAVFAFQVFDDGSGPALYVAGGFSSVGGVAASSIARWDGTSWSALGTGASALNALAVFDDGSGAALYAAGRFTPGGNQRVSRWNGVSWIPLGSGMDRIVLALEAFDDGSGAVLVAGGDFTSAGGVPASKIAAWDGLAWAPLGAGTNLTVRALAVLPGAGGPELVAGGQFTMAGGQPASRIARWDGTSWGTLGVGVTSIVEALHVVDSPGPPVLFATGEFRFAGGLEVNRIARWDGAHWSGLGTGSVAGLAAGLAHFGRALTTFDDGNGSALYAGGIFVEAGGVPASRLARWDGVGWSGLGCGTRWVNQRVNAMTTFDGGSGPELVAGGYLTAAGGAIVNCIARWDGAGWSPLGLGLRLDTSGIPEVADLVVFDDGSGPALYASGRFSHADGAPARNVARWDGTSWSPLGSGVGSDYNHSVSALAVFDDGSGPALYAGGLFPTAGGVPAEHVARWNGTSWASVGSGASSYVTSLGVFDDGNGPALYASGNFTSIGGVAASHVARWDGASWAPLGSGLNQSAYAFQVFDDGSGSALHVGGVFTSAGGAPASHIARWDGTSWSTLGSGVNDDVYGMAVFDDGSGPALHVGGAFTVAGGLAANRAARWDGASWSALGGGVNSFLDVLFVHDDGGGAMLYAGGAFTNAFDTGESYLARWGCSTGLDANPPVIQCPAERSAFDRPGSPPGEVVSFAVHACDETDPAPAVVCVPPSGSLFPPGTTLVTCTATDASGNVAVCSFPVTVAGKARRH